MYFCTDDVPSTYSVSTVCERESAPLQQTPVPWLLCLSPRPADAAGPLRAGSRLPPLLEPRAPPAGRGGAGRSRGAGRGSGRALPQPRLPAESIQGPNSSPKHRSHPYFLFMTLIKYTKQTTGTSRFLLPSRASEKQAKEIASAKI